MDLLAYFASHLAALCAPFAPGDRLHAQGWYRDPLAAKATSLSDALDVTLLP